MPARKPNALSENLERIERIAFAFLDDQLDRARENNHDGPLYPTTVALQSDLRILIERQDGRGQPLLKKGTGGKMVPHDPGSLCNVLSRAATNHWNPKLDSRNKIATIRKLGSQSLDASYKESLGWTESGGWPTDEEDARDEGHNAGIQANTKPETEKQPSHVNHASVKECSPGNVADCRDDDDVMVIVQTTKYMLPVKRDTSTMNNVCRQGSKQTNVQYRS